MYCTPLVTYAIIGQSFVDDLTVCSAFAENLFVEWILVVIVVSNNLLHKLITFCYFGIKIRVTCALYALWV